VLRRRRSSGHTTEKRGRYRRVKLTLRVAFRRSRPQAAIGTAWTGRSLRAEKQALGRRPPRRLNAEACPHAPNPFATCSIAAILKSSEKYSQRAIALKVKVRGFRAPEVISGTLANYPKVIYDVKFACPFCRDVATARLRNASASYLTPVVSPHH